MTELLKRISALNDETRIALTAFLIKNGPLCVCDMCRSFDMSQSRISRHLKILKEANLLKVKRIGTWAYYESNMDEELNKLIQSLNIETPEFVAEEG